MVERDEEGDEPEFDPFALKMAEDQLQEAQQEISRLTSELEKA